jgi:hypothetical protein
MFESQPFRRRMGGVLGEGGGERGVSWKRSRRRKARKKMGDAGGGALTAFVSYCCVIGRTVSEKKN